MKFLRFGLAVVCWAAMTSSAFARCVQADITGLWEVYFPAQEPSPLGGAQYYRCRWNIDVTGAILDAGSYCITFQGQAPVVDGTVTLGSPGTCSFSARFASPASVPGYIGHLTLTKDFLSGVGNMRFPAGGGKKASYIFMMVRL